MEYPNDGFRPPPPPNPPFASTPNSVRTQRPRFAYSGPQNYPRPGSSATKPNPDFSVSDIMRSRYVPSDHINESMINNYGDSYMDTSLPQYNNSFQSEYSSGGSFQSQDSIYYSCNESFSKSPQKSFPTPQHVLPQQQYKTNFFEPDVSILPPPVSNQPVRFKSISSVVDSDKRKPFYKKKTVKPIGVVSKKNNDGVSKHVWRCSLCDIVFTSSIPYNMHKHGSKHAKKLKLQEATQTVQSKVKSKEVEMLGATTTFRCDLCCIIANSPYQLQMHLEGIKHKSKVLLQKQEDEQKKQEEEKKKAEGNKAKLKFVKKDTKVKENEANTEGSKKAEASILKPTGCSTKTDFSCTVCELFLNSEAQLQQHLSGKYHKAKVEGTTLPFHAKKKAAIRKACDDKDVKPNTTEGKASELMEVCESNRTEESSETNKTIEPETGKVEQPETSKVVQPETVKNDQSETAKDSQSETSNDTQPEITKNTQTEKAIEPEKTK